MPSSRLAQVITVVAVGAAFNAALTVENDWPTLVVRLGGGLSVELLVLLLFVAVHRQYRAAMPRTTAWLLTVLLFLLIVGRYAVVTAHSLFGRPINLYFDLPHLPEVAAMAAATRTVPEIVGLGLMLAVVPALLLLGIRWGVAALAGGLSDGRMRGAVAAIAATGAALYVAGTHAHLGWAERMFAPPVSVEYARQAAFVAEALTGPRRFDAPSAAAARIDPAALQGADVFVVFLESYGEAAYSLPGIAPAVRARAAEAGRRLSAAGWHAVTGLFESPTFGGASWLAHASFLTGIEVTRNRDYELLLSSERPSFVGAFAAAGYRTVALMPGLKLAWPEGAFYGYDRIYDAADLGYSGRAFGWWRIPDQFTLGRLVEQELRQPGRKPLFVVFPTIMSHMPFAPVPPYLPDWSRAPDASAYARTGDGSQATPRDAYREAILYDLALVEGFLMQGAPADAVVLVLGDHQPPGIVSGAGASRLVPVHVFARDAERLLAFRRAGWRDGLIPSGAPLGGFAALHGRFAAALK